MPKLSANTLSKLPLALRYLYFTVTSCQIQSLGRWRRAGEPNPFVRKTYRPAVMEKIEFSDFFDDMLRDHGAGTGRLI